MAEPPKKCTNCGSSKIVPYQGADFFHPAKGSASEGINTAAATCEDCNFLMFFVKR